MPPTLRALAALSLLPLSLLAPLVRAQFEWSMVPPIATAPTSLESPPVGCTCINAASPCTEYECSCTCNLTARECDPNCCCDTEVRMWVVLAR